MKIKQLYGGVDRFRMIAAFLIIAIHTSPLLSWGELPDFVFTRVIVRIGVPFFFMATGFFVLGRYQNSPRMSARPVLKYVRRTLLVYAVAVLLYLPVNVYAGQITMNTSFLSILKMLFTEGAFYHLWYLPASVLGVLVVWLLLRYTSLAITLCSSSALFVLGLLGDSYYGYIKEIPFLRGFYDAVFSVFTYSRNGLFFAPVFLALGVLLANRRNIGRAHSVIGLSASAVFMIAEGLALRYADVQRHDSMYVMLPVCAFYLFAFVLSFQVQSSKRLRDLSLIIYVVHPMMIIVVRGIAKFTHTGTWLVQNSIIHYFLVCIFSFGTAIVLCTWKARFDKRFKKDCKPMRAWIEINLAALAHNVEILRSLLPEDCKLMPAVKADAYGFGAVSLCKELNRLGVDAFCVACLAEAVELRKNGIQGEILILGYTPPEQFELIGRYNLMQTVVDADYAKLLSRYKKTIQVHVKIDTGMHRLGERCENTCEMVRIFRQPGLEIKGVFTQLGSCDSRTQADMEYTGLQIEYFKEAMRLLKKEGIAVPPTHVQCSYGIINYPALRCSYARPGLALYGIVEKELCTADVPPLVSLFEVKGKVALTKNILSGERVGYGQNFTAPHMMKVAVVTLGYADGVPRCLSKGRGGVLIHGSYAPIIGNICMDQTMVDVTDIPVVASNDTVVFIGQSGEAEITISQVAQQAQTIPNEIVSRMGKRLEKIYFTDA